MDKQDFYLKQMKAREAYKNPNPSYMKKYLFPIASVSGGFLGALAALALVVSVHCIPISLIAIWTDWNLDFWTSYVKGHENNVPYAISWLCTIPWPLMLFINIFATIAHLFV